MNPGRTVAARVQNAPAFGAVTGIDLDEGIALYVQGEPCVSIGAAADYAARLDWRGNEAVDAMHHAMAPTASNYCGAISNVCIVAHV